MLSFAQYSFITFLNIKYVNQTILDTVDIESRFKTSFLSFLFIAFQCKNIYIFLNEQIKSPKALVNYDLSSCFYKAINKVTLTKVIRWREEPVKTTGKQEFHFSILKLVIIDS